MINLDLASEVISQALKLGANKADAIIFESSDTSASSRLGKIEGVTRSETKDLGLRVFVEDKKGYKTAIISTNNLLADNITKTIEKALFIAKQAPADDSYNLANKDILATDQRDLELFDKNHNTTINDLEEWALTCEDAALNVKGVTNSEGAEASFDENIYSFVTSEGFAQEYKASGFSFSVSTIAGKDTDMQTDYDYSFARIRSDLKDPKEIGRNAGEMAVKKLHPKKISTRRIPVIFDKRVSKSLLSYLATAINGQAIVKKSSFLTNYMGREIFPKNINIIDDPLIKRGLSSQSFDAEGINCEKMNLIENGILKNWILDLRTAKKLGLTSNARASRGVGSHPHPSSSNVYMQNGDVSFNDMISGIKEGLYLTEAFGMGVNSVNGDYSQGASGYLIENGIITYPVSEITVAGNLIDMFKNLTAANDLEMRYSKNAPTLLIEGMTVAGS